MQTPVHAIRGYSSEVPGCSLNFSESLAAVRRDPTQLAAVSADIWLMEPHLPEPPSERIEAPSLRSLPGSGPSAGATTPKHERSKRRLVVGLIVGGLILVGVISNASDESSNTPPPGDFYDSGQTITGDDCQAQGGQIVGDSCYLP
jgi:hypothetical protein